MNKFVAIHEVDGNLNIQPGNIIRHNLDIQSNVPFSDMIVLKQLEDEYEVVRPYGFASGTQTCCSSCLVGYESIKISKKSLILNFSVLLNSRNEYVMCAT